MLDYHTDIQSTFSEVIADHFLDDRIPIGTRILALAWKES